MNNRKHIPDSENKLVILYALNRLGPVTGMQLLQFLVEMDLMNYFGMQLNLVELQEQQQVAERAHPLGGLLLVTEKGAYTLGAFDHRIPASRRELIDQNAAIWHEKFRTEQQTLAESFPLSDGGMCIRLRLMEADTALTLALSEGFDGAVPDSPLPETTTLQQTSEGSWLLSLNDQPHKPTMTLMLSMPDEHLARHYAARWPQEGESWRTLILRELEEGLRPGQN